MQSLCSRIKKQRTTKWVGTQDNGLIPGPAAFLLGHITPKNRLHRSAVPRIARQMDEQIALRPYDGYPPAVNGRADVTRGAVSGARCWLGRGIEGLSAVTQMF